MHDDLRASSFSHCFVREQLSLSPAMIFPGSDIAQLLGILRSRPHNMATPAGETGIPSARAEIAASGVSGTTVAACRGSFENGADAAAAQLPCRPETR